MTIRQCVPIDEIACCALYDIDTELIAARCAHIAWWLQGARPRFAQNSIASKPDFVLRNAPELHFPEFASHFAD